MQLSGLNTGIIYTDFNCIGCNKCISSCIAVGANVVVKDPVSQRNVVLVDQDKCILCGNCIKECFHHARTYRDDTDAFFAALARGEEISILVSPTLLTDYEKQYHNILGYLKHLGVRHIYNTGAGGDLMVWVYMNFIQDFDLTGVVSQFCPVIVNYLEKYKPELLEFLMPVQTPVMCTAIYVTDYLKVKDQLAYLSPCIASKYEVDDVNTYRRVTYNVTLERLMHRLEGMDLSQYYAEDELPYGLGALIPMAGGLSDNIERYIGFNQVLIQTAGPNNIFPYFDHYATVVSQDAMRPFLVEALSCTNGCNFGTGTCCGVELRNEMTFSAHRVKENAYRNGRESNARDYVERLVLLNERFRNFELSSFVRQYGRTRGVSHRTLDEGSYDKIFQSMYKNDALARHTDCGACGYPTCRDMAYAIGMGFNQRENCINYSKECIRLETEKINKLLEEISHMNEELKRSTQLKSNFLANMSHEIRTPMNAIIGMAEMSLRGNLPQEERSYIQQIRSSGRSLLSIINDILDFSKIESGKMELNENRYKVMSIINDTVNIVMTRIGEKDITLLVDADPTIPHTLFGDDIRIKQVLVNLANNAVKFTDSGFVELNLGQTRCGDELYLEISVRDSGRGIKEEDLEKLFTSFQQVDSKRNRNVEGTGLGLVISREFVLMMHGSVDVRSVYGQGSNFSFRIPQQIVEDTPSICLVQQGPIHTASLIGDRYVRESYQKAVAWFQQIHDHPCATAQELESLVGEVEFLFLDCLHWNAAADAFAQAHPEIQVSVIVDPRKEMILAPYVRKLPLPTYSLSIAAVLNRLPDEYLDHDIQAEQFHFEAPQAKVLIVDDNAINLTVAKGLLSPLHMQISVASGAREALELIQAEPFDLVFMDHMMPDIDGVEATHMIRALGGKYTTLPIIALTANAINNAREMFLSEGMDDFVAKPIEMLDISSKLRRWLPKEKLRNLVTATTSSPPAAPAPKIGDLDTAAGMDLAGGEALYLTILGDYHAAIEKKADLIQQLEAQGDLEGYTIQVHALKSASRLIGATALSQQAARLEQCGHDGDWGPIRGETAQLLARYRAYLPVLAPYGKVQVEGTQACSAQELANTLTQLVTALDAFDLDQAQTLAALLEQALVEGPQADLRRQLLEAVGEMEYDDAADVASQWLALLA